MDDGKRSSLYVTFARGLGDNSITPSEYPHVGSADDGKRSSLDVTFVRGFPKGDNSTYPFGVPQTCGVGGI